MTVIFAVSHFILFLKFLYIRTLNLIHSVTIINRNWKRFFFPTFSAVNFVSLSIKFDHIIIYLKSHANSQFQIFRKNTSRLSTISFHLKVVLLGLRTWVCTVGSVFFFEFYSFVALGLIILLSITLYFCKIVIRTTIFIIIIVIRRAEKRVFRRNFSSRTLIYALFSSLV